jgi:hypothetical protein
MRRYKVSVTTAADGTAVAFSPRIAGKIHSIQYVKDGANPYAAASTSPLRLKRQARTSGHRPT